MPSQWVLRALEDEKLETAFFNHAGYKQGLEPYFDLYKVYETIRSDVVDKKELAKDLDRDPKSKDLDNELLKKLFPELEKAHLKTQEEQLKAFNDTVNYYRHANKKRPEEILSLVKCTSLINQLMRRWLELKSNENGGG